MDYAKTIVIDIETCATRNPATVERIRREAAGKRPAQNAAKAKKLEWDTTEAREARAAEALRKTSVDLLTAEVLCVCFSADRDLYRYSAMTVMPGADTHTVEHDALADVCRTLDKVAGPLTMWVGHNIEFDMSILLNRWTAHDITPPAWFPQYRGGRWQGKIWDTMKNCPSGHGQNMVSLDTVCEAYGLPTAKARIWNGLPMHGGRVQEAYEAGEVELILDYCADDVRIEGAVYDKQIFGGTLSLCGRDGELAEQVREIREAHGLTESQRVHAIYNILNNAGRIPAVA